MSRPVVLLCLFVVALSVLPVCPAQQRGWVRKADRTYVFVRGQMKYGLHQNYMRKWVDRPLLHDRSLAVDDSQYIMEPAGFGVVADNLALSKPDGSPVFPETSGRMGFLPLMAQPARDALRRCADALPSDPLYP